MRPFDMEWREICGNFPTSDFSAGRTATFYWLVARRREGVKWSKNLILIAQQELIIPVRSFHNLRREWKSTEPNSQEKGKNLSRKLSFMRRKSNYTPRHNDPSSTEGVKIRISSTETFTLWIMNMKCLFKGVKRGSGNGGRWNEMGMWQRRARPESDWLRLILKSLKLPGQASRDAQTHGKCWREVQHIAQGKKERRNRGIVEREKACHLSPPVSPHHHATRWDLIPFWLTRDSLYENLSHSVPRNDDDDGGGKWWS